jgi:hypothetical protein
MGSQESNFYHIYFQDPTGREYMASQPPNPPFVPHDLKFEHHLTWGCPKKGGSFFIGQNGKWNYQNLPMLRQETLIRCCNHNIDQNVMKFSSPERL